MARTKSVESYEKEILEVKGRLAKAKNRYDAFADQLQQLQEKKAQQEVKRIMAAFQKSNRSLQELMIFLEG